jgi:hypothetical protein
MRQALLNCTYLDWSEISPAIFGSMFQSVMNPIERRNLGAHYTSETNILKLIKPLFLDELWKEFTKIKTRGHAPLLIDFHKKLKNLKFLDPACGCGNFLIITYRELRLLELEILRALYKTSGLQVFDISSIIWLDVDQFYGIEYEEFPARIAEVAMWLIDHQMNMKVSNEFGQYFIRLPLNKAATIVHGDALETNWQSLLNPVNTYTVRAEHADIFLVGENEIPYGKVNVETKSYAIHTGLPEILNENKFDYIFGNPPFIGSRIMNKKQKESLNNVLENTKNIGELDYVSGWYIKAAKYIMGAKTKVAFVSTNSIVQGEQAGILWGQLLNKYRVKIHFAHQPFKWGNEARGNAAVHCVIIGLANYDSQNKTIFEYENTKGEAHEVKANNINPYLIDAKDILIGKRRKPICNVPEIVFGNMPNDGGNFLFTDEEKDIFLSIETQSEKFFRPLISAYEFLNGKNRWCLWLKDANPAELIEMKFVYERIKKVKALRSKSSRRATQILANYPYLFGEIRQPESDYILIPRVSSENRKYIPMGFFTKNDIVSDTCLAVPNADLYHFGVLMSKMHMTWVKTVCGRLEISYRYSNEIVYNNFLWPENPTEKLKSAIEKAAQNVLDSRMLYPNSSLADLYDPLTMPPALVKAHNELDMAVDLSYRPQPFISEANRMEFLFGLYEKFTADLFTKVKEKKKKKSSHPLIN